MEDGRVVKLIFISDFIQVKAVPAEVGRLSSLRELHLNDNRLTSVPAAIRELRAAGCDVDMDDGLTVDE